MELSVVSLKLHLFVRMCMCVFVCVDGCSHAVVQRSEFSTQKPVLSFHRVGPKCGVRLDRRHLYPLSPLTSPLVTLINKYLSSDHIYVFITPAHQRPAIQGNRCSRDSAGRRQSNDFGKVTQLINTWAASQMQTSLALYKELSSSLGVYPQSPPAWPGLHSGPCKWSH